MGSAWRGLFFRLSDPQKDPEKIRREYDEVEVRVHPGASFICVESGRPTYKRIARGALQKLSSSFGEVIDLQVSSEGNLHYEHWKNGGLMRALFWAEGSAWEVEGEPQPWETVLGSPPPKSGSQEPFVDPEQVALCISQHFKLPPVTV
jgi:hypothetical protein